jgi:hypothetical protein
MKRHFIFLVVCIQLFSACHKKEVTKSAAATSEQKLENKNKPEETKTNQPNIKDIIIDTKLDVSAMEKSVVNIESLSITGDTLSIFVKYGGGCKKHEFDLYSDKMYMKSLPSKLTLYLTHNNNGDMCRKLIIRELKFNISAVKYSNPLILKVGDHTVNY